MNAETSGRYVQETVEERTKKLMDIFEKHDMTHPTYWYDPFTKVVYKGSNILPHEEDHKYVANLLYVGGEEEYARYKSWGVDEFHSNGGKVACVGRASATGVWYGWSHRGHGKFSIGYVVKEGSLLSEKIAAGYSPKTEEHCSVLAHIFADLLD